MKNFLKKLFFREASIEDITSIAAFDNNLIINKDLSISCGFKIYLLEEEVNDNESYSNLIEEFASAIKTLPLNTVIQKTDIYCNDIFKIKYKNAEDYFLKKSFDHYNNNSILNSYHYLHLNFFDIDYLPQKSHQQNYRQQINLQKEKLFYVEKYISEFLSMVPKSIKIERLCDEKNKKLFFQYINLDFNRTSTNFENTIVQKDNNVFLGKYLKSIKVGKITQDICPTRKNDFGSKGVTSPFFWRIGHHLRFDHVVTQRIKIIDDKKFLEKKDREYDFCAELQISQRKKHLATSLRDNFIETEKMIQKENTQIVGTDINIFVFDNNIANVNLKIDEIKNCLTKSSCQIVHESSNNLDTFLSNVPGGANCFWEKLYFPVETAVCLMNFSSRKLGDRVGVLLKNRHKEPIYHNLFKYSLDNQNAFIFGPSGSGKSFFNGKMIKERFFLGHTVVVIDSGRTYKNLFGALNGTYIEYNPDSPLKLNPFLLKKINNKYCLTVDKISFLINFISKIWKGDLNKNPLNEIENALLSKLLQNYYNELNQNCIPSLKDFIEWLKSKKSYLISYRSINWEDFFLIFEPFTDGVYKDFFNARDINYYEKCRLICFELEKVKNDSKIYPLVVQVIFDLVFHIMEYQKNRKKFIDIEEGWIMLNDASKDYIESFFRKGRKTNTSIRFITQSIFEIKNSKIGHAMKNNASTCVLLYNDKESSRKEICDFLGLSSFDFEKYNSLRRMDNFKNCFREIFIKEMDKSQVLLVDTCPQDHALLTSRPDEKALFDKLLANENYPFKYELACEKWVKERALLG